MISLEIDENIKSINKPNKHSILKMRIFHCTAVYTSGSFFVRFIIFFIFGGSQCIDIFCFFIPLYKSTQKISFYTLASLWGLLTLLWIWSYIVTCWMDAGSVEEALYNLGYVDRKGQIKADIELPPEIQNLPRCEKCQLPKPLRTHHCSQCDKCYFRFDHHCDVVGNCVAYSNIKAFILFLFYSSILLFLSVVTAIVTYTKTDKVKLSILLMACILGFFLGMVIFVFACTFLPEVCCNNRTTLERISGEPPKRFNVGISNNIRQVFGGCVLLWILPTRPKVDGFTWSAVYSHIKAIDESINKKTETNGDANDHCLIENDDKKENLNDQEIYESLTIPLNPKQ